MIKIEIFIISTGKAAGENQKPRFLVLTCRPAIEKSIAGKD
jgi:hypothetical protein